VEVLQNAGVAKTTIVGKPEGIASCKEVL